MFNLSSDLQTEKVFSSFCYDNSKFFFRQDRKILNLDNYEAYLIISIATMTTRTEKKTHNKPAKA